MKWFFPPLLVLLSGRREACVLFCICGVDSVLLSDLSFVLTCIGLRVRGLGPGLDTLNFEQFVELLISSRALMEALRFAMIEAD